MPPQGQGRLGLQGLPDTQAAGEKASQQGQAEGDGLIQGQ